jgi:hypothetical protein
MKRISLLLWLLLSLGVSLSAQNVVKGTIKSADENEGLVGASVVVQGTTKGTVTDIDGNFELNVDAQTVTLAISYTGYKTQNIKLDGKTQLISF